MVSTGSTNVGRSARSRDASASASAPRPTGRRSRRRSRRAAGRRPPAGSGRRRRSPGGRAPAAPGIELRRIGAIAPVIGSPSLNAVRNGRSQRAERLPGGPVGLRGRVVRAASAPGSGITRGPALEVSSGNGASYAARTASSSSAHAARGDQPADVEVSRPFSTARRNCHHTSGMSTSPVGRPVFAATTPANRSGCSATRRSPIRPPQSWPTSVTSRRSRRRRRARAPTRRAGRSVWSAGRGRLVGAAEADQVRRDRPERRRRRAPRMTWR